MTNFVMKMHFVNNSNNNKVTNKNIKNNNNKVTNKNITNNNNKVTNKIILRNRTISSHLLFNNMFLSNNSSGCGCGK